MKGSKVLKTFIIGSLLVGAALAGPNPSTTVSTQPNPVIKGNTSGREIYMDYQLYDHRYYSRRDLSGNLPLLIIDSKRRSCGVRFGVRFRNSYGLNTYCLKNPRFKITEGNLGDLFLNSISPPKIYRSGYWGLALTYYDYYTYAIKDRNCVKGVLIHDDGSRSGKLCVGYIDRVYVVNDYYKDYIAFADVFVFIPDP